MRKTSSDLLKSVNNRLRGETIFTAASNVSKKVEEPKKSKDVVKEENPSLDAK
jgi:hypothetical protein